VRASHEGSQLAVGTDDGKEAIVYIVEGGEKRSIRRLTLTGQNRFPIWSPDAKRIALQSDRDGVRAIYVQPADGTGRGERLTTADRDEAHIPESWSPDGKYISFAIVKGSQYRLAFVSVANRQVTPFGNVQSAEPIGSVFSPDGRWLAYGVAPSIPGGGGAAPSPNRGVFLQPFPPTGEIYQVPKQQLDFHPSWMPNGSALLFVPTAASGRLASIGVTLQPRATFGTTTFLAASVTGNRLSSQTRAYDVLPDGRLVGLISASDADAPGSANSAAQIRVVVNWFEELKRRVPAN
jgi:Tol biopolymer transport system component